MQNDDNAQGQNPQSHPESSTNAPVVATFKPKSLLRKAGSGNKEGKKKSVVWDTKTLQEQEIERKLHPVTMKIDEPKTPYTEYNGDDEYLKKINNVNKIEYSEDLMNNVLSKLNDKHLDDQNEYLEIEIVDKEGKARKELVKKEHVNSKEFLKKRHYAYANEFTTAKACYKKDEDEEREEKKQNECKEPQTSSVKKEEDEEDEEDIRKFEEQVLNNTLYNKFAGKLQEQNRKKEEKKD